MERESKKNGNARAKITSPIGLPDDFPSELLGEFANLSDVTAGNIGHICRWAVSGGGYFGFSITDDGDSCKLAIRSKKLSIEKRCGSLVQLETLLAYCRKKLTD